MRLHAGKASAAAAAAASTWATDASGASRDHGLGGRVDDLVAAGVAVDALAADEELVGHAARLERVLSDAYRGSQMTTGMSRSVRFW